MAYPLLRFTGAVKTEPKIDIWFSEVSRELGNIAQEWFSILRKSGPDVLELIHDELATVCIEDAPFAYVGIFQAHVSIGFFHGASLKDPKHLLEGKGKYMRHVKIKPDISIDDSALKVLIKDAYKDIKERLLMERTS
ncbi:DUF1801 domain-containing protein [Leptospira sarikeiensis]|uniref:DUF1801 domain-containing protein n=1 Tax=Leptospira sarikeiensis TaxID=2484943 RepID=A0A4V3JSH3_9LEPT|nr:DUF1801 domain-containing protein [Leptospira sarikeiensis]TGL64705.1 DUF1801 domain-containing protein [Leptospira sarikeiensis]